MFLEQETLYIDLGSRVSGGGNTILHPRDPEFYSTILDANDVVDLPAVLGELGPVRLEVGEHQDVRNVEHLDVRLVLGREDPPILELLEEGVDGVELVLLSAREVEDYHSLVVVGMCDVGHLA